MFNYRRKYKDRSYLSIKTKWSVHFRPELDQGLWSVITLTFRSRAVVTYEAENIVSF